MEPLYGEIERQKIETTLGELICAIADAALEARVDENEIAQITQTILSNLLDSEV